MTDATSTGLLAGAKGAWQLDPKRTTIEIHTKAMWGIAKVKGTFSAVSGGGVVGDQGVSGELVVDAGSINTKNNKRDAHLRSADFFDVDTYPTLTFTASEATASLDGSLKIKGTLRIKDQSRPIELNAAVTSLTPDRATVQAETTLDRSQWGMSWAKLGARLVNRVVIAAEFVRA